MRALLPICSLGLLTLVGCFGVHEPGLKMEASAPPPARPVQSWPVTADQINEKNAHQMTQTLLDELDREDLDAPRNRPETPNQRK